jgi:hypothetical protein
MVTTDMHQITVYIVWRMRVACWITKATRTHAHTHKIVILLFHGDSGYANAPHCYVIRTFPVLFRAVKTLTKYRVIKKSLCT